MRIGFDISQTCESKSGTGFFADQMVKALADVDKENDYILLPYFYDYRPATIEKATKVRQNNFKEKIYTTFDESTLGNCDIVHSNNFRFPKDIHSKKVVTLYDVCFMDCPEYTTEANRLFCYQGTLDSMLWADKIIAISEYTKKRLLHFFPFVDEKKVEVVYCGNRHTLEREKDDEKVINKLGLAKDEYFLSVGTIEPRKNYGTLLKAYKLYKEKNNGQYKKLCIAGGYGWLQQDFSDKIRALNLENDVAVTGYVSEEQLANLYRYCYAFVYTTWYEGFGLPVLEAMNFRKAIIASKVTSIPEIVGNCGLMISPENIEEIAEAMSILTANPEKKKCLEAAGKEKSSFFSWKKSAEQLLNIYSTLV